MSEPYFGGETVAFLTGLTALRRANGVPLEEAFAEAESARRALVSKNGSTSMGRGELLAFLREFDK
ncbi:hypothetical protein [Nocardia suismassiliense]|uniref:hypothetical protein n=1 Tax=Nocardia suismassiliense TaxID=2077092 RepID=UPI000D1E0157|nr:hypothetical protein [Nocardia suismassiliense]